MEHPGVSGAAPAAGGSWALYLLVSAAALLTELALLGLLGVVGWHFGGGGLLSVALAVLGPALAGLIWSIWIAPTAAHRLGDPGRLVLQILMFVLAAVLAGLAGRAVWGVVLAAVGVAVFSAARAVDVARDSAGRHTA
jgi:uncharacterized protein DUF2568